MQKFLIIREYIVYGCIKNKKLNIANATSAINVQVSTKDKKQATEILNNLGVSMSTLINMTLKQVIINNGIPFEVKIPQKKEEYDI